jgi:hypothetical protein
MGAAALAVPAAASAQEYYDRGYDRDQPRGDYDQGEGGGWFGSGVYPEFKRIEAHIRGEIRQALREDMIEPDDARDLIGQLRQIQWQERREFRVHGWNLPEDDRERLRDQLGQLDHQVDQIRNEP